LIATNTLGQTKWSSPVGFYARPSANFNYTNATERIVLCDLESFDAGNNYNGTIFTAPVNGIYTFSAMVESDAPVGTLSPYGYVWITVNSTRIANGFITAYAGTAVGYGEAEVASYYLTNGAPVFMSVAAISGYTNRLTAIKTHFSGALTRELP
jgi:hypothetical protein